MSLQAEEEELGLLVVVVVRSSPVVGDEVFCSKIR
jgi:hypothetical protein